jgi:hypothetical protein
MINAQQIAEMIDEMLKDILTEKVYPYGHPQFGIGNKVASGSLRNSIEVQVVRRNDTLMIEILANDYFQWVQSGRAKGKKGVPISAILAWMRSRGIQATDRTNDEFKALQSQVATAYIINKGRIKKGKHALPMDVLINWIKEKKIVFNIDLQKGMAFAIQKNIIKFGIRPANIEDKLYDQIASSQEIVDLLGDYTFEDLVDKIEYNFTANTK